MHKMITVVIPTCHRNDLLAKCLDSLAPGVQTLPTDQYEVIVTDDGSKSTAEQMLREQYPWAQWVAGPRKGPAANRNNGAKYAQGEWLAFTDDDCLPSAGWLEAYLLAIPLGHLVYEGKTTCVEGIKSPLYEAPINLTGGSLWSCNLFVTRELFLRIKGFDEQFAFWMEDADFRVRLQKLGIFYCFVESAVVDHPPRLRGTGQRISAGWEAHVQHWHKEKMPQPSCAKIACSHHQDAAPSDVPLFLQL